MLKYQQYNKLIVKMIMPNNPRTFFIFVILYGAQRQPLQLPASLIPTNILLGK
jgi:hypothetical protein